MPEPKTFGLITVGNTHRRFWTEGQLVDRLKEHDDKDLAYSNIETLRQADIGEVFHLQIPGGGLWAFCRAKGDQAHPEMSKRMPSVFSD